MDSSGYRMATPTPTARYPPGTPTTSATPTAMSVYFQPATSSIYQSFYSNRPKLSISQLSMYRPHSATANRSAAASRKGSVGDPRNISCEHFRKEAVRKVIEVLVWSKYTYPINPKILTSPSRKDFLNVLGFLLKQIDAGYVFDGNTANDEIPMFFKELGYPYSMSKSSLVAPGTTHQWPHHLAALAWLCELIQYEGECFPDILSDGYDRVNEKIENDVRHHHSKLIIDNFLLMSKVEPEAAIESVKQALITRFEEQIMAVRARPVEDRQTTALVSEQCQRVRSQLEDVDGLLQQNIERAEDLNKLKTFSLTTKQIIQDTTAKLQAGKELLEKKTAEMEHIESERGLLQNKVDTQGITREEVQLMQKEMAELRACLEATKKDTTEDQQEIMKLEHNLSSLLEHIKPLQRKGLDVLHALRSESHKSKMASASGWAGLPHIEMDTSEQALCSVDAMLGIEWKTVKAALQKLREMDMKQADAGKAAMAQMKAELTRATADVAKRTKEIKELDRTEHDLMEECADVEKRGTHKSSLSQQKTKGLCRTVEEERQGSVRRLEEARAKVEMLERRLDDQRANNSQHIDTRLRKLAQVIEEMSDLNRQVVEALRSEERTMSMNTKRLEAQIKRMTQKLSTQKRSPTRTVTSAAC
eukprot:GHVS01074871.1.p1 GENE.GHVS01074871.1~~GHVS01074871.1.p1  ORF type:complete len:646 (-),score=144.46 GHVS01074871.1:166-2103(-)